MSNKDPKLSMLGRDSLAGMAPVVLATAVAIALGATPVTALSAVNILNPSGGSTATDGLRIYTENARYQVSRLGLKQVYQETDSGGPTFTPGTLTFALYADGTKFVPDYPSVSETGGFQWFYYSGNSAPIVEWTSTGNTLTDLTDGNWRNVETLTASHNSRNYVMTVTTDYTSPNTFAELTVSIDLPAGLAAPVALYLVSDFYLAGGDSGPTATGLVGDRRYVVQTRALVGGSIAVGGILESDGAVNTFTSYKGGVYREGYGADIFASVTQCFGPCDGSAYPNTVDPASTDAGVAAHWVVDLTTEATTFTRKVKVYFSDALPSSGIATMTSITNVDPSPVLTGGQYTVSGQVSLEDSAGAPSTLPGKVDVLVDGSEFCTDSDLTDLEAGIYEFSCSGTAGDPGEYGVEATYTDTSDPQTYITSADTADQTVNAPPPVSCDGFFTPVDRHPTVNRANAGRTIPLKWRCTNDGVPVDTVPEDFQVTSTGCNSDTAASALTDSIEEYAGKSGLISQGNGYWQFNWATPKGYANSCRTAIVTFDGVEISADFRFVR